MSDVTQILQAIGQGDAQAANQLLPLVYGQLRELAARKMAQEKAGHTLDPTALVHEAYLRLVGSESNRESSPHSGPGAEVRFTGRRHFFAAAAQAMRNILVDQARRKQARKRGGDRVHQDLAYLEIALPEPREDLLELDEAIARLARSDPQAAELVHLRFFAGFTLLDAAEVLGVSPRTAHRLWAYARAYLHRELQ